MDIVETTREYTAELNQKFLSDYEFTTIAGRKYDRIMTEHRRHGGKSVHAFVERSTGYLYKPASLTKPADGARYDLSTMEGFTKAIIAADAYGSYLYKR